MLQLPCNNNTQNGGLSLAPALSHCWLVSKQSVGLLWLFPFQPCKRYLSYRKSKTFRGSQGHTFPMACLGVMSLQNPICYLKLSRVI